MSFFKENTNIQKAEEKGVILLSSFSQCLEMAIQSRAFPELESSLYCFITWFQSIVRKYSHPILQWLF